jgi:hypothetical protein
MTDFMIRQALADLRAALVRLEVALEHWPAVQHQLWRNEDELSRLPLGQPIGDDFSAGRASVCLELERDGWVMPPVLLPLLAQIARPGNQA